LFRGYEGIVRYSRTEKRKRRHIRVRKKVVGTPDRPRLVVFRSSKHIYAQLVDDTTGKVVAAASTLEKSIGGDRASTTGKVEIARAVGKLVGERALKQGIERVVFDRGGYKYHGRVAALADAAREAGLEF
jgi:large subunit ribosomal protein L18